MNFKELYPNEFASWSEKFKIAHENMMGRGNDNILIECAAQHPLLNGINPGEEFTKRLDMTISIYRNLKSQGKNVKIYVPGSRHMENGVKDKISLSLAGKMYLIKKGINANDIYSVSANRKYNGLRGVYNSADECFVASEIFKKENFDKLISVVSPAQMYRKTLFYIQFGVIPQNYTAPTENMYHNYVNEIFGGIPFVLTEDNTWQESTSHAAVDSRNNRCPYLRTKISTLDEMKEENFDFNEYNIEINEVLIENKLNKEAKMGPEEITQEQEPDYPQWGDGSPMY